MGGYGSTRWNWFNKRVAAEDCQRLPFRLFKKNLRTSRTGKVTWSRNGEVVATIGYWVVFEENSPSNLRLIYTITRASGEKQDVNYPVRLTMTPLPWGGSRYWYLCPAMGCGRRVSVLYLAPGGTYFLCRHCYNLSYRSRQEGYQTRAFYGHMAEMMKDDYPWITWREVREIFKE